MVELTTYVLIAANVLISVQGFNKMDFREKYLFHVGAIRWDKEYIRMVSSGFLHGDWMHLLLFASPLGHFGPAC